METANLKIRREAAAAGVRLWEIAEALGVSDSNFSRMLRRELPEEKRQTVLETIKQLSKEGGAH